jgi:glutathione S-transferase
MTGAATTALVGSYLSPYVRKVLVCLELKGVAYRIDPIVPFHGDDEFARISPLRRVPVLIDDAVTVPDSSVICEYLDERYPEPRLKPRTPAERARARWLEEFAGSRMGEVIIWRFFNQLVIRRFVWGEKPDDAMVNRARDEELPAILDYLEGEVPAAGFLFGDIALADVALGSFFRNAAFVKYAIDAAKWPKSAAYVARVLDLECFRKLRPFEELSLRTPIARHREALREAGAPVTGETRGAEVPRRPTRSLA